MRARDLGLPGPGAQSLEGAVDVSMDASLPKMPSNTSLLAPAVSWASTAFSSAISGD